MRYLAVIIFLISSDLWAADKIDHHLTCAQRLAPYGQDEIRRIETPWDGPSDIILRGTKNGKNGSWVFIAGEAYFYENNDGWPQELSLNPENNRNRVYQLQEREGWFVYSMSIVKKRRKVTYSPSYSTDERDKQDKQLEEAIVRLVSNIQWGTAPKMGRRDMERYQPTSQMSQSGFGSTFPSRTPLPLGGLDHDRNMAAFREVQGELLNKLLSCYHAIEHVIPGVSYREALVALLEQTP